MRMLVAALMILTATVQAGEPVGARELAATRARVAAMDWWQLCVETGKALRRGDPTNSGRTWRELLLDRAAKAGQFQKIDARPVRRGRLRVGMSECAVVAALGKPNRMSQTEGVEGRNDIWGYDRRSISIYVYFVDGAVTSWQE